MNDKFFCYSTTLMYFLKANAIRYDYVTRHRRTKNRMWVFNRDERLTELLAEYDARKAASKEKAL
ncbi:hypothetical protein [Bacillus sp. 005/A4HT-01/001]|uniref:hypothetical protein n=1 Tax=Bacillus sp. 005/A4HT-01/001 TaxID=2509010 RepID=UPI0010753ED1|nr:hypothetical protein [Bacillus sp. 005/A4HT-01/001]TFW48978.1 hypothetical protein ES896_00770 [Bacillus sp. 005/A4HT-01/001]